MSLYYIDDYNEARRWLRQGRNKFDRPMYTSNLRLKLRSNGDVEVFCPWIQQSLVTIHSNDVRTIQVQSGSWNPLFNHGIRNIITRYSGITRLYQKKHKFYLVPNDFKLSPAKIQKCRGCSGSGKRDGHCVPDVCWQPDCQYPNKISAPYSHQTHHYHECVHGMQKSHKVYRAQPCYYCNGSGKRDYGSNAIAMLWDGSPLRLIDGNPINSKPTELEKAVAAYVNPISS